MRKRVSVFGIILLTVCLVFAGSGCKEEAKRETEKGTFTNPLPDDGQVGYSDPWVIFVHGNYYYCGSDGKGVIFLKRSAKLQDILLQESTDIFTVPRDATYSNDTWAPELHYLCGKWYVYFAGDDGDNADHRMICLEGGSNPNDPLDGTFRYKSVLKAKTDRWAIDGTVLTYKNQLYFVWSGWEGTANIAQNLYLAKMSSPYALEGDRAEISSPTYLWERVGKPYVNEGPEVLEHNGTICIIYSASGSWTDDYCLGQLKFTGNDPMEKASWSKKSSPAFKKTKYVFGPGHASFVSSPDGKESWIVYHAALTAGAGWKRNIRTQQFYWNTDNTEAPENFV